MFDGTQQSTPAQFYDAADSTFKFPEEDGLEPLEKLNNFLQIRDISPLRHVMRSQWEDASERTKRRYVRNTRQAINAVLEEVAPNQHHRLWQAIISKPLDSQHPFEEQQNVDSVLMEALAQCYENTNKWDTKRQILSIMADKVSYSTLQTWIPELTRYRFTAAKKHILVKGRGISLSHAMRPGLIRHFWVANRAEPENDNKSKERVLKINIESFGNIFVVKNVWVKFNWCIIEKYIQAAHRRSLGVYF